MIEVLQLLLPAMIWAPLRTSGLTADDAGDFPRHGQGVFDRQRAGAAEAAVDAAAVDAAGKDLDDVLAEGGDAGLDLGLGAIADADHGDDRAHADDDAQHGQRRPHLVPAQRAEGDFEDDEVAHGSGNEEGE